MIPFTHLSLLCVETGGTDGLFAQKTLEITGEVISSYKNQGGYDMLGRTRDQIRTTEQVKAAMTTCQALKLDALVIIGGIIYYYQLRQYIVLIVAIFYTGYMTSIPSSLYI
jgi:hypothetical protein